MTITVSHALWSGLAWFLATPSALAVLSAASGGMSTVTAVRCAWWRLWSGVVASVLVGAVNWAFFFYWVSR